jgi:hypothetical protein
VKSKPKGQSSAGHGDLKRIFESFLNDPADGDALDFSAGSLF